ncbi:MAG TPA: site-specific integrase [Solirubrobacterales bacterium]|nr:site-specific integrase [Solirubrobacterales bacterium]
MAEGIIKRHSAGCPAKDGKACRCRAGYEAWVYLPHEKKKVRKTFARKAEAKSWRATALTAASRRTLQSPSRLTVEQAAWLWLEAAHTGAVRDRSGHTYKPGTLREYQRALRLRVLSEFGERRLSDLSRAEVQNFVDRLLGEGLSPSTVANTLNPLQAIYRHAVRRDLATVNPTREVELPADRGRRDRIATAAEAARLLAALPDSDRPIWATAFYAGLRRGELQALRPGDVDLASSEITVQRSWDQYEGSIAAKSKAGHRTVPIIGALRPYLEAVEINSGTELLFGRTDDVPFAPKSISQRAERAWEQANKLEQEAAAKEKREPALLRRITLHECRHTFASLLIDAGVNAKAIQEFMGHATIEETFSRYGHLMPGARDQARELVDAYFDAACGEPAIEDAALAA